MDDNRVSPSEERALTNAIERAATVASINKDLDCNKLLVSQLKKASIDPKFAKTASQAFNKRLTVLTFQKTADEHKADSFPLTDADTVYNMMVDETPVIEKAAAFKLSIDTATDQMEKAASEKTKKPKLYEYSVSLETFQQHLHAMMDKYASAFEQLEHLKDKLTDSIAKQADEVAAIFKNAHYDYDFTTAVNLYGDKLKDALGDRLDKEASFEQTSSFVIKPQKAIFSKVAKLMEDRESLESITKFEHDFACGLAEFCKSAAQFGNDCQMLKIAGPISDAERAARKADQALADTAAMGAGTGAWQARANAIFDTAAMGLGQGLESGVQSTMDIGNALRNSFGNARALYAAGNNVSASPGDLLDAAFLTKDRYRDRLLAWSDMSADPLLAMYPAEQVFQATNKAMDMDTSMERPDQRELLRTQVAQLLAQNNRVSTADIAALATTLKELAGARNGAVQEADRAVQELSDKEAPEKPELTSILGEGVSTEGFTDLVNDAKSNFDKQLAKLDKIDDDARAEHKKKVEKAQEKADKAKETVGKTKSSEIKKLMDIVGYHPAMNAGTGSLFFTPNKGTHGKTLGTIKMKQRLAKVLADLKAQGVDFEPEAIAGAKEQLRLT